MIFSILLPFHILIALSSIAFTLYSLFKPTKEKLVGSYAFVGLTLATGTALVILKPQHLTTTCVEGLVYVGLMLTAITFIKQKISGAKLID